MFKVLIVDDEIYVVALIRKLIDWEKYQMEVVAAANDGIQALKLVKELNPDLVIVDIRMPGYDGITFMDAVREFNDQVKFIVISGHKQFDYAKGAIRNNVEDYLLKPINKEELETILGNVRDQLLKRDSAMSSIREMREKLDGYQQEQRQLFVAGLLAHPELSPGTDLDALNRKYYTRFQEGCFRLLCFAFDRPSADVAHQTEASLVEENLEALTDKIGELCFDMVRQPGSQFTYLLLNYPRREDERIIQLCKKQNKALNEKLNIFKDVRAFICAGNPCSLFNSQEELVNSCRRLVYARTAFDKGQVLETDDIRESEIAFSVIWEYYREKVTESLSSFDVEDFYFSARSIFSKAFYEKEEDTLLYHRLYKSLVGLIYTQFSNMGICSEDPEEFEKKYEELYQQAISYSDYAKLLRDGVGEMIEQYQLNADNTLSPSIRIVKKYIADHYREDLSLSAVADVVHLSPVYLSRLFKKEEGVNFLEYVNQYRLDVAKKLLKDVHYNVLESAELSGFKDTKYFAKYFKKHIGITPSEYKKRHLGKDS